MVIRAILVGGRVLVPSIEDSRILYADGFYGKPLGVDKVKNPAQISSPLILDPLEALYLVETGKIQVEEGGRPLSLEELHGRLRLTERQKQLYVIYRDLRSRGLVVRSGLKYGASFLAYRRGPGLEHAPFIVHFIEPDRPMDPVELVLAGRLGHSVRKTFVLGTLEHDGRPTYLMLKWFRP